MPPIPQVALWNRFETVFDSIITYANPLQDASQQVEFTAPSGKKQVVDGFWDGGSTWRVRFLPNETGLWTYTTSCSDSKNSGLGQKTGDVNLSLEQIRFIDTGDEPYNVS